MSARARSMALDTGTSVDAAEAIASNDRAQVRAAITVILSEAAGPLTDEEIIAKYLAQADDHATVPWVTPQRIRTARSELVRDGQVRDAQILAFSSLGNRASAWVLT